MFLAVQFDTTILGALLGEGFKRLDLCVTDSFDGYLVDRILIDPTTSFAQGSGYLVSLPVSGHTTVNLQAHAVAFSQAISVILVTETDLAAAGPNAAPSISLPLTITFDLRFDVVGGGTALTLTYQSVSSVAPDPRIALLDAVLKQKLPPQTTSLDLAALVDGLGVTGAPAAAGANLLADGETIEFRLEMTSTQGSNNQLAWEDFYNNGPDRDFHDTDDWAVWVSVDGLEQSIAKDFTDGLQANSATFDLVSDVEVAWQPGEPPKLVVTFNGDAIDACICFWNSIDVNTDVTVTITFSIDQGDIRYDIHLDYSANGLQLFCCEVTSALFWPFVGAEMLGGGTIDIGNFIEGILGGPLLVFIAAIVVASSQSAPIPTSALPGTCTKDSDTDTHCLIPVPSGATPPSPCVPPSIETRALKRIFGIGEGLVLPGRMVLTGSDDIHTATQPVLDCVVSDFAWLFPDPTCSGIDGELTMSATVTLSSTQEIPLRLCSVTAIGDTAAAYQPYVTVTFSYCPMVATVHVDVPAWDSTTGPCQLLLQTTAGVRIITLDAVTSLTPAQIQAFDDIVKKWRLVHCYTKLDDWYRHFRRFNPKWSVDPPNYEVDPAREAHGWEVAIGGAITGDTIALFGASGERLTAGQVDAAGNLRLGTFTLPAAQAGAAAAAMGAAPAEVAVATSDAAELAIQRLREGSDAEGGQPLAVQLLIQQILLVEQAQILVGREPVAVYLTAVDGRHVLVAAHRGGVSAYDISNAAAPRLIRQHLAEVRGARRGPGNRLLSWDADGVLEHTARTTRRVVHAREVDDVRFDAALGWVVRSGGELSVHDERWRIIGQRSVLDEDAGLAPAAQPAPGGLAPPRRAAPSLAFGAGTHSRFGLVARLVTDGVSLAVIAGTRRL